MSVRAIIRNRLFFILVSFCYCLFRCSLILTLTHSLTRTQCPFRSHSFSHWRIRAQFVVCTRNVKKRRNEKFTEDGRSAAKYDGYFTRERVHDALTIRINFRGNRSTYFSFSTCLYREYFTFVTLDRRVTIANLSIDGDNDGFCVRHYTFIRPFIHLCNSFLFLWHGDKHLSWNTHTHTDFIELSFGRRRYGLYGCAKTFSIIIEYQTIRTCSKHPSSKQASKQAMSLTLLKTAIDDQSNCSYASVRVLVTHQLCLSINRSEADAYSSNSSFFFANRLRRATLLF